VADVVQVIQTEVRAPVVLLGQSMGGHTAMLDEWVAVLRLFLAT
jgi:alpha-beta hydrolase superfamily lysophospholipase